MEDLESEKLMNELKFYEGWHKSIKKADEALRVARRARCDAALEGVTGFQMIQLEGEVEYCQGVVTSLHSIRHEFEESNSNV